MKKAIFAGSFDPFTLGHLDILEQSLKLCDEVTVLIAVSPEKKSFFSTDERVEMLEKLFTANSKIKVQKYEGIVIDYARENQIDFLVRGVRNQIDLQYEQQLSAANKVLAPSIQTVLFMCEPAKQFISSTYVREFLKYKKDISELVPEEIKIYINNKG